MCPAGLPACSVAWCLWLGGVGRAVHADLSDHKLSSATAFFCNVYLIGSYGTVRSRGVHPFGVLGWGLVVVHPIHRLTQIKFHKPSPSVAIHPGCPHQTLLPGVGEFSTCPWGHVVPGQRCPVFCAINLTFLHAFSGKIHAVIRETSEFVHVLLRSLANIFQ